VAGLKVQRLPVNGALADKTEPGPGPKTNTGTTVGTCTTQGGLLVPLSAQVSPGGGLSPTAPARRVFWGGGLPPPSNYADFLGGGSWGVLFPGPPPRKRNAAALVGTDQHLAVYGRVRVGGKKSPEKQKKMLITEGAL